MSISGIVVAVIALNPSIRLNNGVEMPVVAAGTWQYDKDYAQKSVTEAIAAGFTHIDTAHDYCADGTTASFAGADCTSKGGSNQVGIAPAIKGRRAALFLTTKVPGCGAQGTSFRNCGADSVAAADKNLAELGVHYVDLLLIHFPPLGGCGARNCHAIQQQWHALTQSHLQTNKTRALGVSNFCISCLKCLAETPGALVPAVNQFQYHVGMGADPGGLVSYCKAQGIVPQAYSPLGDNTTELITGDLVNSIGKVHNKTGVQVALRWIWQHGVAVTTKSGNLEHLKQDLDLFDWQMSDEQLARADAATSPKGKPSFMCCA